MKKNKWMAALLGFVLGLGAVAAHAEEVETLTLWIGGDKAHEGVRRVAEAFEQESGIAVVVETPGNLLEQLRASAGAETVPDIVVWPHDRLGEWVQADLVQPITLPENYKERFHPGSWRALTYDGTVWGIPLFMESLAFMFNPELISRQDIPAFVGDLERARPFPFLWDYENPFFTWPFLAGAGAYLFAHDADGRYNPADVGLHAGKAAEALETLRSLVYERRVVPRGADYGAMTEQMRRAQCAMILNGPWSWADIERAGITFELAPIPGATRDGPGRPFVGVLSAFIHAQSQNPEAAITFLREHLVTTGGISEMDDDTYSGVAALNAAFEEQAARDPRAVVGMQVVNQGNLMPNIPQMEHFWGALGGAIQRVMAGEQSAEEALRQASHELRQAATR